MTDLEHKVAAFYAPKILAAAKFGECAVCVWFPGTGRSTVLANLLRSRVLLRQNLGVVYRNAVVLHLRGELIESGQALDIWSQIPGGKGQIAPIAANGKEVILVVDSPEVLADEQLEKLLMELGRLVSLNRSRIHTVLNVIDLPRVEQMALTNPIIFNLFQRIEYLPVVSGNLLTDCFEYFEQFFSCQLRAKEKQEIVSATGGIFTLSREFFRNSGGEGNLELKLQFLWQRLPGIYREIILKMARGEKNFAPLERKAAGDLEKFGVLRLKIFRQKYLLLAKDPAAEINALLSPSETSLYKWMRKNTGKLLTREMIARLAWKENDGDYSDWALDQIVSRLRRKLRVVGLDEALKTIKGKGYRWQA